MKTYNDFIAEGIHSVLKYTWDKVSEADVRIYMKRNDIKIVKDPKNKGMIIGTKNGKFIFRYDPDNMELVSDYTIAQLEGGRVK
jgi:hypothetical protein